MAEERKLIVGYDLGEEYSEISCYSYKTYEPLPIGPRIPTVLCLTNDTKTWLYGEEAQECAAKDEGILVDNIFEKLLSQETTNIGEEEFIGSQLLEKFFRRTLILLKKDFPTELITKIVVTVRDTSPLLIANIKEALFLLGIEEDRGTVISHSAAYIYYALNQDSSLWINDVGLFDFSKEGLKYYQIQINRRTKPKVASIVKKDYSNILTYSMLEDKEIDHTYILENAANQALYKQIISTLYFTGEGFDGGWAENVLKRLSIGRRAFIGTGMYSKGACYAAKEMSEESENQYILIDEDMIINSVYLLVYGDGKMQEHMIAKAGTPWYEVNNTVEIIPDNIREINLYFHNIMTKETVRESFILSNLPDRPNRMTRLGLNISFISKDLAKIKIKDLGFGDLYPASNHIWEFNIAQNTL